MKPSYLPQIGQRILLIVITLAMMSDAAQGSSFLRTVAPLLLFVLIFDIFRYILKEITT